MKNISNLDCLLSGKTFIKMKNRADISLEVSALLAVFGIARQKWSPLVKTVILADSRPPKSHVVRTHEPKDCEKLPYKISPTTITLLDCILKGVGRHHESVRKKGGMKAYVVIARLWKFIVYWYVLHRGISHRHEGLH